jgi:Ca-activated chloride channel family protein
MTQLAGMSDGHHAFVQHSDDLAKIFAAELNTALNVVAKQITIKITCAESIRPIRVLGRIAEIRGQTVQITFNQLSSNQEKYVLLEIEVPLGAEGARQNVATVDVAYQDLQTKKTYALQDSVFVDFSKAREDVVNSFKQEVMDAAAEQVVNEMSKDVVTLRDKGKLAEARKVLTLSTAYLKKMVENGVGSPRLEQLEKEIRQDAKDLDHQSWATNRKSLRQKQYKLQNQQVY